MKALFLSIVLFAGNWSSAQDIVDQWTDSTAKSLRKLVLFSDSTFAYIRGNMRHNLTLTMGEIKASDSTLYLVPYERISVDVKFEKSKKGNCSKQFSVVFISSDEKHFGSDHTLALPGSVVKWDQERYHSLLFWMQTREVRTVNEDNFLYEKPECQEYELALTGLYPLFLDMHTLSIPKNVNHVEIHCSLPFVVAQYTKDAKLSYHRIQEEQVVIGNARFLVL